ncbi:MAG: AsmA family protein [Deltaproteobacteria bacterium]|nr:AsmA family protein [Deltaproteobacteria bacterium]
MNPIVAPFTTRRFSLPLLLRAVGRYRRHLLLGVLLLVGACFVLLQVFDNLAARHRDTVQQELHRILGKDVNFDSLEATLWGGLGFVAKEFRIDDDRRFAATPFLRARALHLGLSLLDLARGRLVIDSLALDGPEFQVIADENGLVNVTALVERKKALSTFPRIAAPGPEKLRDRVNFTIRSVQIVDGQLYCVDRSGSSAATLQIRNVQMHATGLGVASPMRVKITGALTGGLTQDITIQGSVSAPPKPELWTERQLDLDLRFDSLHLPLVVAALPGLKDNLLSELGITAPSTLRARLTGTLRAPILNEVLLKVPLFGATEYNAIAQGTVKIPADRDWAGSEVAGTVKMPGIDIAQLRRLSYLKNVFSQRFQASGSIGVSSNLAGSWRFLRVGARIDAGAAELSYAHHLKKPAGTRALWQGQFARRADDVVVHDSRLYVGGFATTLTGHIASDAVALRASESRSDIAALIAFLEPQPDHSASGAASWDLRFNKDLANSDNPWLLRGTLQLHDAALRPKQRGQALQAVNGTVHFTGDQARADNVTLRYGASPLALDVTLVDLTELRGAFRARAQAIQAADFAPLFANHANLLRNFVADGNFEWQNATPALSATVNSSGGTLEDLPFQDLRAELVWSPQGTRVRQLSLRTLGGTVQAVGTWASNRDGSQIVEWSPRLESVDLTALLEQKFPRLKTRVAGRLDFRGRLAGGYPMESSAEHPFTGDGEVLINKGLIKNFNLVAQLFGHGNRGTPSSRLPAGLQALVERPETVFDSFKGSFKWRAQRLSSDDLILATPNYTITGAGWVATDRSTRWNGLLVLSPSLTQELQREYKMLRYFVDRRGRLAIAFRVDGTLPNLRIRPENRALAQALRWGTGVRGGSSGSEEKKGAEKKKDEWLPRSLEEMLR